MSGQKFDRVAPLSTPLPEPPAGEVFSGEQWLILMSIMDTIIPSIHCESSASDALSQLIISDDKYNATVAHLKNTVIGPPENESLAEYLDEKPSSNPEFQDLLKRSLAFYVRDDARKGLAFILSVLK